jgi:hypothetical protein
LLRHSATRRRAKARQKSEESLWSEGMMRKKRAWRKRKITEKLEKLLDRQARRSEQKSSRTLLGAGP